MPQPLDWFVDCGSCFLIFSGEVSWLRDIKSWELFLTIYSPSYYDFTTIASIKHQELGTIIKHHKLEVAAAQLMVTFQAEWLSVEQRTCESVETDVVQNSQCTQVVRPATWAMGNITHTPVIDGPVRFIQVIGILIAKFHVLQRPQVFPEWRREQPQES